MRFQVQTTLGAHGIAAQLALNGRAAGLDVTHEGAGGWFTRTHLFIVKGSEAECDRFHKYVKSAFV